MVATKKRLNPSSHTLDYALDTMNDLWPEVVRVVRTPPPSLPKNVSLGGYMMLYYRLVVHIASYAGLVYAMNCLFDYLP